MWKILQTTYSLFMRKVRLFIKTHRMSKGIHELHFGIQVYEKFSYQYEHYEQFTSYF